MHVAISYGASFIVIIISIFSTLIVKSELERVFREKRDVFVFHVCNVLIVLMAAFTVYAALTWYIFEQELHVVLQMFILLIIILPSYIAGHFVYEKYKFINRKYTVVENGKVLIINEKYLRRKL